MLTLNEKRKQAIENLYFDALVSYLKINSPDLFTIDLYKDSVYTERDNFIREYPNVIDFFSSFLLGSLIVSNKFSRL